MENFEKGKLYKIIKTGPTYTIVGERFRRSDLLMIGDIVLGLTVKYTGITTTFHYLGPDGRIYITYVGRAWSDFFEKVGH